MASTSNEAPAVPPSLSLPPSQFARLQPHAYLLAHLSPPAATNQPSIRANGREPLQFRTTSANCGSLTHTNGSAVVRIGDTAAVCGVRAELLHTDDIASWSVARTSSASTNKRQRLAELGEDVTEEDNEDEDDQDRAHIEDLSLLVPNLSLSTGCAPGYLPGAPPSTTAQSISHEILSLLHSSRLVKADDLRIWYQPPNLGPEDEQMDVDEGAGKMAETEEQKPREIKAFWVLYIDIMIISLAGNPFDAAWASVVAALRDTKLPNAWWDVDNETVLCSDDVSEAHKLTLRGLPVASSFCVFEADAAAGWRAEPIPNAQQQKKDGKGRWILADPDGYEDNLAHERVSIVVDKEKNGKTVILKMEKVGGWTIDTEDLRRLVDVSSKRWDEMKQIFDQC